MTTRRDILGRISARLAPLYGAREARSIALVAVSELSGLSASALLTDPGAPLEIAELDDILGQLAAGRPVQYVVGRTEFCGRTFECVDKGFGRNTPVDVVIRPEDLKIVYAGDGLLQGVVESIVFKGVHYEMMVRTQFFTFTVHSTMAESVGKTVGLSVIPFDIHIMHKSAEAEA